MTTRNVLLIRGMGGAGKTTLLKHLGAWWHTTGFKQRFFYFGYDEKAWTLQQIMTEIAQRLYGPNYYTDFQPLSLNAQQAMLARDLRSANHLLILDNLESITGAYLAIQHTLSNAEQDVLRSFLADLAKGHTLVLLGSRGGETWLAKGTFDDNIYDLPGLDPEAASTLADRILEKMGATRYRKDEDLRTILKVLDGFPLALEVVLANLKHQTPQEILAALQEGDVKLDLPESEQGGKSIFEQKTESILRCIDYSHSNLSQEAQQLLLCLAPFTSVINTGVLDKYTNHLRQQPILTHLPFERWREVIQEAQNWGLLSPDPDIPRLLRLQPIFPYFLRHRLHEPAQAEVRIAVETAFREHYDEIGHILIGLILSKDPQERNAGQILTNLEYENFVTALNLALTVQVSIYSLYGVLTNYLDITKDEHRGLQLGQTVLASAETYPPERLTGQLGAEFALVIGDTATRQFHLKHYVDSEMLYQRILKLVLQLEDIDEKERGGMQATTYHHLGMVAEEQREFQQAEQYYQLALQINIEYNDHYNQASTYHHLGRVAQEQREFQQAQEYFLKALVIMVEYKDTYSLGVILQSLARLWKASGDAFLPAVVASILGASVEETEALLRERLED